MCERFSERYKTGEFENHQRRRYRNPGDETAVRRRILNVSLGRT